jgi:putative membrane protein
MLHTALASSAELVSPAGLATLAQHYPGYGPGPGAHLWFLLIPLFWLIVAIVLVAVFGRRWSKRAGERREFLRQHWQSEAQGGAEKVLAERFARGDIDEVEYRARLEVIRSSSLHATQGPGAGPGFGGGFGPGTGTGPGMPPQR